MVDPVNPNPLVVKPVDQTPSAKVARTSSGGASVLPQSDVAEVSSSGLEHTYYMSVVKSLPEVRPDVVSKVKEGIGNSIRYPPLNIIEGMSRLFGDGLKDVE